MNVFKCFFRNVCNTGVIFEADWLFLEAFAKLWKATVSFVLSVSASVRMQQLAATGRIFMNLILPIFQNYVEKTQISSLLEDIYSTHLVTISCWILLRMINISDKSCRQNQNTCFMFNTSFLRKSCRSWNNVEKYSRARQAVDNNKIRHMHIACWIPEATNTHSQYVIRIAFARQQSLRERAWILPLYTLCLSCYWS